MSNELTHHGILGMKWGVRRTPEQLGHKTGGQKKSSNGDDAVSKSDAKKTPGKSSRSLSAMSDDELRSRINRLNMEEQYRNLVARQKDASRSPAKKALLKALDKARDLSLDYIVTKGVEKITKQNKNFSIDDYKDMDVYKMDGDIIKKVADWYTKAGVITKQRSKISSSEEKD